ncbi:MAG TPA: type II CAAX endopeptidase family protein [Gemmatimonadales bacterium]|nr:type II CAAX endopeptidase family protein [Gemmatimonadales bacterium]
MARVSFAAPAVKRVAIAFGWVMLFFFVAFGVDFGLSRLATPPWSGTLAIIPIGGYEVIGFLLATYLFGRFINEHSWSALGWRGPAIRSWLRGLALGAAMASLAIVLGIAAGARLHFTGDWNAWAPVALPLVLGLILAALGEELAFRGYPMRHLSNAIGVLPAIVILALPFAIAHVWNPNATVFSTINVGLAAIWLSVAFFSAGGMPLAWGAHFGWNAALAILFAAPVSGFAFHVPVVEYAPGMHHWIDGGAFGPEGGIVATIALICGSLFLLTRRNAFTSHLSPDTEVAPA